MKDTFDKISRVVRIRKFFSIEEAANVLSNQSPFTERAKLSETERTSIKEIEDAITEALHNKELKAYDLYVKGVSYEEYDGEPVTFLGSELCIQKRGVRTDIKVPSTYRFQMGKTKIEIAELAWWCEAEGIPHPFELKPSTKKEITTDSQGQVGTPKVGAVLSDDPEIRARQLEQENAEQKRQIESLKQQLEEQKQEQRTEFLCMTHELELVAKLQRRFLVNIDYKDPDTYPKQKHCLDYLKEQDSDLSDRAAHAIDRVAMPFKR